MIYDISGSPLTDEATGFEKLINIRYKRDDTTGAFYTILNIPQTNNKGEKQYPFVYWPNYPNGGIESTLTMNKRKGFLVAINGGRASSPWGPGTVVTGLPKGTVIQNSVLLQQGTDNNSSETMDRVLTINNAGELGYAGRTDSGATMIENGIVSAVTGFVPIMSNYLKIQDVDQTIPYIDTDVDSQRQVLGQYGNGDYVILSTEGRGNQGSGYFSVRQLQDLCISHGIKHAFLLDGGGSMETVVGKKQLNPIYEETYGRLVATYIVWNGTTEFQA